MMRSAAPRLPVGGIKGTLVSVLVLSLVAVAAGGSMTDTAGEQGSDPRGGLSPTRTNSDDSSGGGKTSGPAENTIIAEVYVATAESARTFSAQSLHGVSHYRINVVGGAPFELRPLRSPSSFCLGSDCVQLPDFDIAFFREYGGSSAKVGESHYRAGFEAGTVPDQADFAHVYLRTSGVVPDNLRGYAFVYLQGNPGSDRVPDWE